MDNIHYELLQVLSNGAFGHVELVKRCSDGKYFVFKYVYVVAAQQGATEIRALNALRHPLIVRYDASFLSESHLTITMEYMAGGTLHAFLHSRESAGQLVPEIQVYWFLGQLLIGLQYIHEQGILHRDLKPKNVLLSANHRVIKIADFGISKCVKNRGRARSVVGTPEYMSPELCRGMPYGTASDVWALGCITYEMLTLKPAFSAPTIPGLVCAILESNIDPPSKHYTPELQLILRAMLKSDPEERAMLPQIAASPSLAQVVLQLTTTLGAV